MLRAYLKQLTHKLTVSVETAVTAIDYKAVIKNLVSRAEITGSYLLMIVKSGRIELQLPVTRIPLVTKPAPPSPETLATLRVKTIERIMEGCQDLKPYLNPYPIRQCTIRFSDQRQELRVRVEPERLANNRGS